MGKERIIRSTALIFSKKTFLSLLLIFFSIGSYTYSEGSNHPITPKFPKKNLFTKSTITFAGINTLCIKPPINYYTSPDITNINSSLPSENIMDNGKMSLTRLARFITSNNSSIDKEYAIDLAMVYIDEATIEGVNPDIAFTQMCLETGFLRFDGTVKPSQNNFCGLGVTGNGVTGLKFKNERLGVRAHIQHLKAYASINNLNRDLVDTRFNYVKRGSIKDINGLTGKWATDKQYDKKIRNLLHRLYSISLD